MDLKCYDFDPANDAETQAACVAIHGDINYELAEAVRVTIKTVSDEKQLNLAQIMATLSFIFTSSLHRARIDDEIEACRLSWLYSNFVHATLHAMFDDDKEKGLHGLIIVGD